MKKPDISDYNDIINAERPEIVGHQRMSMTDRGAQFSPFAALVGFEDAVEETVKEETEKNMK